ncbi:ABC transporter permease [Psychrobacter sp. Cmf 22.2]|uniref:ABC transporter permease n=1 Tax=Psychrobacter sp. Cmf 22.2 TaxID=1926478 RepID=UPI000946B204|nr:ABC transporter permease [Psychrobacter sp. Cmf 22.2]OLF39493.1 beta-carotene 15,15'-monooxygenase [Psychrobacter sp. Cmf 22.2]
MRLLKAFIRSAAYERRFLAKNQWDLAMVLWIPLATVLLVWWIFSQTQITDLPIGVIDQDNGPIANTLVRYLEASPALTVHQQYHSPADVEAAILQRDVYAVVVIPEDFSRNISSSKPAPIVLQVNAQYGTHSGIIQTSVQSVVGTLSAGVEIQRMVKQGMAPSQAAINYSPIAIQRTNLFNAINNYQQFLASTVIPALLHILAMVIGATTIGRELRDKQLGRWSRFIDIGTPDLILANYSGQYKNNNTESSNNIKKASLSVLFAGLLGKYFWPILAYSIWSALALWLATPQQSVDTVSLLITYMSLVLLIILSFWLGAVFTLGSFSLRMGLSATGFISVPSYAFAGVTYPYIAITDSAKYWADALPLTHYLQLHIAQLQMQAPLTVSLPIVYGLLLATVIAIILMVFLTKRALSHPERWGAR